MRVGHAVSRRVCCALVVTAVALTALVGGGQSTANASAPVKIKAATMVDSNANGRPDEVVLTYARAVNHTLDTDGAYPFTVAGHVITAVDAATASRTLVIHFAEKSKADAMSTPKLTYTPTADDPVTGTSGTPAAAQTWTWTFPQHAVYVSATGSDTNPGTQAAPVRTVAAGVALAASSGFKAVEVTAGSYNEGAGVTIGAGVTASGGFASGTWFRTSSATTVSGRPRSWLQPRLRSPLPTDHLFAATYPERTAAAVLYATGASHTRAEDYPWAATPEEWDQMFAAPEIPAIGSDEWLDIRLKHLSPSIADDPEVQAWWRKWVLMSASPSAVRGLARMNRGADVRHVLASISVPTVVLHPVEDQDWHFEEGRYIADRIPGAELVELPGLDHGWWVRGSAPGGRGAAVPLRDLGSRRVGGRGAQPGAGDRVVHGHRRIDRAPGRGW